MELSGWRRACDAPIRARAFMRSGPAISISDGHSDILWQNTNTGQASIWEMNGTKLDRRRARHPQSRDGLAGGRNGRFQRRRLIRHPVAEHEHRPGLDLGHERQQAHRRRARDPQSGAGLEGVGTGDFNKDGHSDILWQNTSTGQVSIWEMTGNTSHRRRPGDPQSRHGLASHRHGRFQ